MHKNYIKIEKKERNQTYLFQELCKIDWQGMEWHHSQQHEMQSQNHRVSVQAYDHLPENYKISDTPDNHNNNNVQLVCILKAFFKPFFRQSIG